MAYIYQAPKDFDEQSVKVKQKYGSIAGMLHSGEYDLQLKYDGVFSATYTTSAISETRQQKAQPSAARIASALKDVFGSNMLVFSELWTKGLAHKAINGMSRRDEVQQELGACIFDMISVDEFNEGRCSMPYAERYERIKTRLDDVGISWIQPAQNVVIEDVLGTTEEALIKLANAYQNGPVSDGVYDGLILRKRSAIWVPGASKDGAVVKIKPAATLDLRITAQDVEQRATKLGGTVTVTYKGVETNVGGGLTQEQLAGMMLYNQGDRSAKALNLVGLIAEITFLEVTDAGRLREPRIMRLRHDTDAEEDKG